VAPLDVVLTGVQGPVVGGRELTPKHSSRQGISVGKYYSAERTTYKTNLLVMSGLDAASQSKSTTSGDDEGQHHNLSSQATHLFHQEDSHQPPLSLDFSGLSGTDDGLGNHVVNHIGLHDPRGSLIGDLHRVGDHPKLDEMTMLEAVNPSDTHEDTQESRDTDPDIKRVKVSHAYSTLLRVGILHLVLVWFVNHARNGSFQQRGVPWRRPTCYAPARVPTLLLVLSCLSCFHEFIKGQL
jgi:hypothetical protein